MKKRIRCPYCHADLPERLCTANCPSCGKTVGLPAGTGTHLTIRERQRKLGRIEREFELKNEKRHAFVPQLDFLRKPTFTLGLMLGLLMLGLALSSASRKPGGHKMTENERIFRTREEISVLASALSLYKAHVGHYPTYEEGELTALFADPGCDGWRGPYITCFYPDRWGRPYRYFYDIDPPKLFSHGPDKQAGTEDDIVAESSDFELDPQFAEAWTGPDMRHPSVHIGDPQDLEQTADFVKKSF